MRSCEILRVNQVYDPATDTWTEKRLIPYGVYSHSSIVVNNKIYLISGQSNSTGRSVSIVGGPQTQIYNTKTDSWTIGTAPPQPAHRSGAVVTSGALAPKRIYGIGREIGYMQATNITQIYDPETET